MVRHRHRTDRASPFVVDGDTAETLSPEDIKEYVDQYVDRAKNYIWYFHPAVPLTVLRSLDSGTGPLDGSPQGWKQWLERERNDIGDDSWGADFTHWLTTGGLWERDTAIVATEQHGLRPGFGIQDGNHRTATAHEQGMETLPAYLGIKRPL